MLLFPGPWILQVAPQCGEQTDGSQLRLWQNWKSLMSSVVAADQVSLSWHVAPAVTSCSFCASFHPAQSSLIWHLKVYPEISMFRAFHYPKRPLFPQSFSFQNSIPSPFKHPFMLFLLICLLCLVMGYWGNTSSIHVCSLHKLMHITMTIPYIIYSLIYFACIALNPPSSLWVSHWVPSFPSK